MKMVNNLRKMYVSCEIQYCHFMHALACLVCFELATSSRNIKYLLPNSVGTLDIWLIPHLRNLTFVSQNYVIMKRDMNQIC
jgi:hypothetical protein